MTIARAFTRRLGRGNSNAALGRADSIRKDISSPITLLSTTNMISYEAPDVSVARMAMSHAANATSPDYMRKSSDNDSTGSSTPSAPSLTDGSSLESSPTLEYNHLTCYFPGSAKGSVAARAAAFSDAPAVPRRAVSHSKREHERLARKRSVNRSARASRETSPAPKNPIASTGFDIAGVDAPATVEAATMPQSNNFGREGDHLNDIAEDSHVSVIDPEAEEDAKYLKRRGLCVFTAADYTSIIGSMWQSKVFEVGLPQRDHGTVWI